MSTITKERVAQYANDPRMCNVNDEIRQIARIALASLEAEPVAWMVKDADTGEKIIRSDRSCFEGSCQPLFAAPPAPMNKILPAAPDKDLTDDVLDEIIAGAKTSMEQYLALSLKAERAAQPAPVSVPDENGLLPCPCCGGNAEFDYDDDNLNWISCNVCGISTDTAYHTDVDTRDKLREVWNRRAAMLQGADVSLISEGNNHVEHNLDMVNLSGGGTEMVKDGTFIDEGTIPVTQIKPVADLYGITSPTGSETSFTFDAIEACDFIDGGWLCQEYVELERFQEAVSGNSPVIPDGWVACSERMPETDGNYWGWWSESKRQGPVWFIKSDLQAQFQSSEVTHWMPLPAAPKQESV